MLPYNKDNKKNSQALRKNMTPEEKHLWYDLLKLLPFTVRRQHPIYNFIVDFYISEKKLVIEIDGIQHAATDNRLKDAERDSILSAFDIRVLRIPNASIRNSFTKVCEVVLSELGLEFKDLKNKRK